MKQREYLKELREMTEESLKERVKSLREERMKLRFRKASGQLNQHHRLAEVKAQLAQALTVCAERTGAERFGAGSQS